MPQILAQDSFTGPDSTYLELHEPDVGGWPFWTRVFGSSVAALASNKLKLASSNAFGVRYICNVSRTDGVDLSFVASAMGLGWNGLVAHQQPNGDLYVAGYDQTQYFIYKVVGGVGTYLATLVEPPQTLPVTFMLKVREGDDYLRFSVNGVEKVITNDLTLHGGLNGLLITAFGSQTIFDSFLYQQNVPDITPLDAPDVLDAVQAAIEAALPQWRGKIDPYPETTLRSIPRIVLRYLDSPIRLSPMRSSVVHIVQVEIIVAPLSDVGVARKKAASYLREIKQVFMDTTTIIDAPNQTSLTGEASQWMRNVIWNKETYFAAGIILRFNEVRAENYGP